ncbi:MAG: branched-chain amino acid ABC transporter permease [Actinobacteria bacterium]|nr:MAG: branched-chain amino acid ABC transporter permease [Actinomycetota bacterium]
MARPRTGDVRGWFGDRSALENRLLVALAVDAVVFVLVGVFSGVSASFILTLAVLNLLLVPPWSTLEVGGRRIGRLVQPVGLITLALTYPFYVGKEFQIPIFGAFPDVATGVVMLVFIMMAIGLNIVVGYAGLLDLGYVAFYAIGAYTVAWFASVQFAKHNVHFLSVGVGPGVPGFHISIWLLLPAAGIITALAGVLIGLPTLRLRGDYLAIVTLGFGEILPQIARNGDSLFNTGFNLTNGPNGITPIDAPGFFGVNYLVGSGTFWTSDRLFYWTALALVLITAFCSWRLRDSRLGRAWIAIREDETAAAAMGVPLMRTKTWAYATGAFFGGVAGAFYASFKSATFPGDFFFNISVFILCMVILGGMGNILGVVVGAAFLAYLDREGLANIGGWINQHFHANIDVPKYEFGIFGIILLVVMLFRPEGLIPSSRRAAEFHEGVADEPLYDVQH